MMRVWVINGPDLSLRLIDPRLLRPSQTAVTYSLHSLDLQLLHLKMNASDLFWPVARKSALVFTRPKCCQVEY
jgi:hypothetical protein